MLARLSYWMALSAMLLASASAEPATGASVAVETELARKGENAARKPERRAPDRIWSGVILATNPEVPKPVPKELREYEASLKRMFGYDQFVIVGTATEAIDEESEHWLLPVHSFSLQVTARRSTSKEARGGYLLDLQLFQVRRPLVSTVVKLAPASPVFIRGPGCGKGEIIIILQVQH